nr:serine/arginine repetitive matrix protein 2 [Drosophila takahashii]
MIPQPPSPEKSNHMDDPADPAQIQSPSDGDLQSAEASDQEEILDEIHIKSEPFCEDLWDVLDELGDILDEEQAENQARNQADLQNEELAESEVDENPETPPPPSISLTDDFSLFTRRERPASFDESLQESGEISSSEESAPVGSINSPNLTLMELRSSPEENPERCRSRFSLETTQIQADQKETRSKSKERKHSPPKKCVSRSPSPKFRGRRGRSRSRSSAEARRRSSPVGHRRRRSKSREHTRSRRRSHSRERQERRRRPHSPRRRLRSRSRSRSRSKRNRRSRDASPRRHSPFRPRPRSPRFVRRELRRHSPERRPRHRSRSTSRPAKSLVRHRLGNKVRPREPTRSTSPPGRSPRSRSKSAKITQRVRSRSRSKNRPPKRESPRSSSPPKQKQPKKPLADLAEAKLPQESSSISPRPISPMVTLHDNRVSRPEELRQYLLATPPAPHVVYTQTQYMEYSAHHFPGYPPAGPYGRPPPELGPFDLRRRLATTRTLCYLRPNDLRHRIQDMYAPPPAFNAYAEWPTGYPPGQQYHPSGYY